jgi:hypothetical protein
MRGSGKLANKNYYIEAFFVKQKYISVIIIIFFSSSDVTGTTCFGHRTIIRRRTVVYCLKLLA